LDGLTKEMGLKPSADYAVAYNVALFAAIPSGVFSGGCVEAISHSSVA
jgi:hypothetical protein